MRIGSLLQVMNETLVYDKELEEREKEAMRKQYGTTNLRIFKDPKTATQYQMKTYIKKIRKPIIWNGLKTPTTRGQNRKNDITFYRITNEPGFMKYNTQISKYENSPKEYGVKSVYGIVGQYSHTTHAPKSDKEYMKYWKKNADKKFEKDLIAFSKDSRYNK